MGKHKLKIVVSIIVLVFTAFGLRVYQLGQKSFWYDEACSISFACRDIWSIFSDHYLLRPLYFVFLNVWSHLFGVNEIIIRMPSVIFGVLSVLLIYKLGKELFGSKTGLIAAFLLTFSYYHIVWCQQARNYSLLVVLSLASSFYFFKMIRSKKYVDYCAYAVFTSMAILTSAIAVSMLLPQYFYYFARKQLFYRKWWLHAQAFVCIILLFLSITVFIMKNSVTEDISVANAMIPGIHSLRIFLGVFSYGGGKVAQAATAGIESRPSFNQMTLLVLFLLFYLAGIFMSRKHDKINFKVVLYLIIWQWVPLILFFLYYIFSGISLFSVKYFAWAIIPYYLVISIGIASLKKVTVICLVMSFCVLFNLPSFKQYYKPYNYLSWRELSSYLKPNLNSNDIIILYPLEQTAPFWLYFSMNDLSLLGDIGNGVAGKGIKINGVWRDRFLCGENLIWGVERYRTAYFIDELSSFVNLLKGRESFWLIVSRGWIPESEFAMFIDYFSSNFVCTGTSNYPFEGLKLYRFTFKEAA
jgi:mannosyltransferase